MKLILIFTIIIDTKGENKESGSYCSVEVCESGNHTMCKYPATSKPVCEGALQVGLQDEEKMAILDQHNEMRRLAATGAVRVPHQPRAANMMKLKWSREAELIAQRWVNSLPCGQVAHDTCRSTQDGTPCGQNGALSFVDKRFGPPYTDFFKISLWLWLQEVMFLNLSNIENFKGSELLVQVHKSESYTMGTASNYTQLVWATTEEVGCGTLIQNGTKNFASFVLICNYKPGGNIKGRSIYERGVPCSKCPKGTHCSEDFPGLCTAEDDKDNVFHRIQMNKASALKPPMFMTSVLSLLIIFKFLIWPGL